MECGYFHREGFRLLFPELGDSQPYATSRSISIKVDDLGEVNVIHSRPCDTLDLQYLK